ncbi:MAG: VCBS repeat-containing protein [Myxococcota bacterium]
MRTLAAGALATLVAAPAGAALREYRMHFQPSPTAGVAGYTMHLGMNTGDYGAEFDLGLPPAAGGTVVYALDLEDSVELFVALRAYGAGGAVSAYSNEIRLEPIVPDDGGIGGGGGGDGTGGDDGSTGGGDGGAGGDDGSTGGDDGGTGGDGSTGGDDGGTGGDDGDTGGNDGTTGVLLPDVMLGLSTGRTAVISQLMPDGSTLPLTMDSLASKAPVQPSTCDLEGDGDRDLVVGFGKGSRGTIAILRMEAGAVVGVDSITAGTELYRSKIGLTTTACGDLDGDGRAEIVVGFNGAMRGVVQIFDDVSTGFAPMASARSNAEGYMQVPVPHKFRGTTYPALGDIDGDDRAELVVGLSNVNGGMVVVLEDSGANFAIHPVNRTGRPWVQIEPSATSSMSGGIAVPSLGDIDGDGVDEMAVGFGSNSRGRVAILDDAIRGYPARREDIFILKTGRIADQDLERGARPAFGDVDGDGVEELVVGFQGATDHGIQVFDDLMNVLRPIGKNEGFIESGDLSARVHPAPSR